MLHSPRNSNFHFIFLFICFLTSTLFIFQASHLLLQADNRNHNTRSATTNTNNNAIFYNIYIPEGKTNEALRIVREQMLERKTQTASSSTPVYYTLIGNAKLNSTLAQQQVTEFCGDNCHVTQVAEKGGEEVLTLQSLFDYCTDHHDAQVTYIHNKGSLHPTPDNRHLRRLLTKSVLTPECQSMMMENGDNDQCNVCGARFSPFPHWHMPGNMWTAKCSYVSKLIPPNVFANEMAALMEHVFASPDLPRPTMQQLEEKYYIGLGRFAYEHWIGSHPTIQPCDIYPGESYLAGYINVPKDTEAWTPDLQRAPRFPASTFEKRAAWGDWFCGQARLVELHFLYGRLPIPENSFLWSFYKEPFKSCKEPLTKQ